MQFEVRSMKKRGQTERHWCSNLDIRELMNVTGKLSTPTNSQNYTEEGDRIRSIRSRFSIAFRHN